MTKKRLLAGFLAATMTLSCFTACSTVKKSDLKGDMKDLVAATYGNDKIYLDEVNYYLRNNQISYEYYYSMYGMSDVWSDSAAVESLFEATLASINQTKVLNEYAKENNITLTADEEKKVSDKVDEIASSTEKAAVTAGQDKDMLTKILTENAIANKAYHEIIEATEIKTKEEDCVQNAVQYILFEEAAETEEDAEEAEAAEAETQEAAVTYTEADANAALDLYKKEKDLDKVAEKYSLTASAGNYGLKEEQSTELGKAAIAMKKDEAKVVYEEGTGWYLIVCTSENDEAASKQAYDSAVAEEKNEHFQEVYEGLKKQKFDVQNEVVESLDVANTPMLETETEAETADVAGDAGEEVLEADTEAETE